MNETYVIDGTNMCWWYDQINHKEMSMKPLLTVLIAILENDDDFYCVFDASTTHLMNNQEKKEDARALKSLLKNQPKRFFRVTGSTRADGVILHDANYHNRKIITNDIYRDYKDKYQWLSDKHTEKLIQGNLQPSGLMTIEKLPYGDLMLETDLKLSLNRLHEILTIRDSHGQSENDEKENLEKYTKERDDLQKEISNLIEKLNETRANLEKIYGVKNFTSIEKEINEKLRKIRLDITSLETKRDQEKNKLTNLESQVKDYRAILDQKKRDEEFLKLEQRNDKSCIKKANKALKEFLEVYSANISLSGSTWAVAIKKLQLSLEKSPICTYCYDQPWFRRGAGGNCNNCGKKGVLSNNPQEIWKIILSCAPK